MAMDNWSLEKACGVVRSLSQIVEYLNQLPSYSEEDNQGRPTVEAEFATALTQALLYSTSLLAHEAEVDWKSIDTDLILGHGEAGYRNLLRRYALSDFQCVDFPQELDIGKKTPLDLPDHPLLNPEPGWTFATFDVQRPLQGPVSWQGVVVNEARQRVLLRRALQDTQYYALDPKGWLLLWGPSGAGKTHLATAIYWDAVSRGLNPLFLSALDIRNRLNPTSSLFAELSFVDVPDIIVIDDLQVGRRPIWNEDIEHVLRARLLRGQPTVIISSHGPHELPRWVSDTITQVPIISSNYRTLFRRKYK